MEQIQWIVIFITSAGFLALSHYFGATRKLGHISTTSHTLPVLSTASSLRFLFRTREVLEGSISRWPKSLFKVPNLFEWIVIAGEPALIDEICKAPEYRLSADAAVKESVQSNFTFGLHTSENPYHIPIIRAQMTRSLPLLIPEIHDELVEAFKDLIPLTADWSKIKAMDTVMDLVSRATNRVFVGVPLCRDPRWIKLGVQHTTDVVQIATILRPFPSFMRPFINKCVSNVGKSTKLAIDLLKPLLDERRKESEKKYPHKTVDMLTWLMDEAKGQETEDWYLASRMLLLNFNGIHTSTMTFTHVLYYLATYPEYMDILRQEIETITSREGWTKSALDQMHVTDSFIKESQRLKPLGLYLMNRVAMKDYQFSNGTTIPAGTTVAASLSTHTSEEFYDNPNQFDGLRFIKMKDGAAKQSLDSKDGTTNTTKTKFGMVTTAIDFLAFGHGRHACPGRYFAADVLKILLAMLVMEYDVRTVVEGERPKDTVAVWQVCVPNPTAEVLFRRRRVL